MMRIRYLLAPMLCLSICTSCQNTATHQSALQYPAGYPANEATALQQLQSYPLPRYLPGNHLLRLFNWMDPLYLAGNGQPDVKDADVFDISYNIQQELALQWNYGIVIPNAGGIFNGTRGAMPKPIVLANEYPNIPLDVITFWTQGSPKSIGYDSRYPMIFNDKITPSYSISFVRDGAKNTEIKFNFPDTFLRVDGDVQKFYLSLILKNLKRPINRINENGEEPPGPYLFKYIQDDPAMIHMKDSMKINSWQDFASTRKLQMRNVFSSTFMQGVPELKNTSLSFYITEGGPIDRFDWHILKKCMTPINGIYYSTPDFYPRWPNNWKDWTGAWHGWKWIEIGRKTEIADGDYLFSPFVAAGWSKKNEENITPGQWLGLLKCLAVAGAEFYYVGYFNLSPPFAKPADYIWQAAMPAYAQAITSRFEDVLKNGNVLFDDNHKPVISYPTSDTHVLITARKANNKNKYVICGTYQPFSNDSAEIPEKRNVSVTIDKHNLQFEVRRQGSVYIYEKTPDNRTIFYQLDRWHENAHPEHWSKDFYFEAEVVDSGISSSDIYTESKGADGDYTNYTSYIHLEKDKECFYNFRNRDTIKKNHFLWLRYKGNGTLFVTITGVFNVGIFQKTDLQKADTWKWIKIPLNNGYDYRSNNTLKLSAVKGEIDIDKFVITTKEKEPLL